MLILYDFVKLPQSFFCSKKTTGSPYKGACVGQPQGLSLRIIGIFSLCEAPASFHFSLFTLLCPSGHCPCPTVRNIIFNL